MLSKKGCEKALARIVNDDYYFENDPYGEDKASAFDKDVDMIEQLIDEHFEVLDAIKRIIDKAKELSDSNDELRRQLYFIEPYKLEDLKPNMWVWDNVAKECLYVIKPSVGSFTGVKYFSYLGIYKNLEEIRKLDMKFEENRFFPVQCANWNGSER